LISVLVFAGLFALLQGWDGLSATASEIPAGFDGISALGDALISPDAFVLPFEVASVLLVAALVGAVYVAFNRK
jgi:NADH-quinone oxidoreductase subunit J